MSAPLATGNVEIEIIDKLISVPYVDMTLKLMERFGVRVERYGGWERFSIKGGQSYKYVVLPQNCSSDRRGCVRGNL
jgi:3-phosphoshikimate 1-carboxyvinyltransferase